MALLAACSVFELYLGKVSVVAVYRCTDRVRGRKEEWRSGTGRQGMTF